MEFDNVLSGKHAASLKNKTLGLPILENKEAKETYHGSKEKRGKNRATAGGSSSSSAHHLSSPGGRRADVG